MTAILSLPNITLTLLQMADEAQVCLDKAAGWRDDLFWQGEKWVLGEGEKWVQVDGDEGAGRETGRCREIDVEVHPLVPFLPREAKVLMLGSFPPQRKRWSMDFYFPNFINDQWRLHGLVFYGDRDHFVRADERTFRLREIVDHLRRRGIGLFDTGVAVRRLAGNAADDSLQIVVPTDVEAMARHLPELRAIVTTGTLATRTALDALGMVEAKLPRVGESMRTSLGDVELLRLPSSSRAYPLSLAKKAEQYAAMAARYGLLRL